MLRWPRIYCVAHTGLTFSIFSTSQMLGTQTCDSLPDKFSFILVHATNLLNHHQILTYLRGSQHVNTLIPTLYLVTSFLSLLSVAVIKR